MADLLDPELRARKPHWALHAWNGAGFLTLVRLAWHRSSEPWFLGVYSLPYFVFLVFSAAVLLYLSVLFNRFGARGFQILLTILGGGPPMRSGGRVGRADFCLLPSALRSPRLEARPGGGLEAGPRSSVAMIGTSEISACGWRPMRSGSGISNERVQSPGESIALPYWEIP